MAMDESLSQDTLTFFAFKPQQDLTPLGEFTLEPIGRGLYLTHFSANPIIKMSLIDKFQASIQFHRLVFDNHAAALFGITPENNKKAIATALRFGYKSIDTIPNIGRERGKPIAALFTILTAQHFYHIYGDRP